jgi:hypothetical protein
VPGALRDLDGTTLFHHDLFTNGIAYVDLAFDAAALAPEDAPFLGLLGRILLEMGTATEDYTTLARRIRRLTGGIHATGFHGVPRGSQRAQSRSILRAKATTERAGALFDILRDVLLTSRTDNRERLRQIVIEEKARLEGNLLPSGHGYVLSRLGAQYSPADWVPSRPVDSPGWPFCANWPPRSCGLAAGAGPHRRRQGRADQSIRADPERHPGCPTLGVHPAPGRGFSGRPARPDWRAPAPALHPAAGQ